MVKTLRVINLFEKFFTDEEWVAHRAHMRQMLKFVLEPRKQFSNEEMYRQKNVLLGYLQLEKDLKKRGAIQPCIENDIEEQKDSESNP